MRQIVVICTLLALAGCEPREATRNVVSDIKSDESLVFFRTSGWYDADAGEWHLPIHGWIFEPEDSLVRKAAFEKALEEQFGLTASEDTQANLTRRLNLLIADNERGKRIVVAIAGGTYELPASLENGHFQETITVSAADAAKYSVDGLISYRAVIADSETRDFAGTVRLIDAAGISVISDIDDTVKISHVVDRRELLEHTFLLDFVAAPGMAELYREWSSENVAFHFVSSSPWQLYEPLTEFLDQSGFPWATFSLKAVRFRDETLFELFRKGTETKPLAIEAILDRYPGRQFILVGDSGEQDPEVYAAVMRDRPGQIARVYIRNVTGERADDERYRALFANIDPDRWRLFDDPSMLPFPVAR